MSDAGIYIHIPFCEQKCPYCDFYSVRGERSDFDRYTDALLRAIETAPFALSADSLYFGGGTPPLLGAKRLLAVREAAAKKFGLKEDAEITVEANPCTVDTALLCALVRGGFNRISFGVQSADDRTLLALGRRHTAAQATDAVLMAKEAGFAHVSADLMLAVPGQTTREIAASVETLAALGVDHLSAYLLKIEPETPFAARVSEPDEDFAADCYLAAAKACDAAGFFQYEISNFSKNEAAQSRHNLKYWRCAPYLGIGSAAHSFAGGRRFYFPRNLGLFCGSGNPWDLAVDDGAGGGEEERIMLGLRLAEGIAPKDYSDGRWRTLLERAGVLEQAGLAVCRENRIALTRRGFLVSNAVIASLLA